MTETTQANEAADGQSQLTEVLDAPTCAIGGVFRMGIGLAACGQHGWGNKCYFDGECEHKQVANAEIRGG